MSVHYTTVLYSRFSLQEHSSIVKLYPSFLVIMYSKWAITVVYGVNAWRRSKTNKQIGQTCYLHKEAVVPKNSKMRRECGNSKTQKVVSLGIAYFSLWQLHNPESTKQLWSEIFSVRNNMSFKTFLCTLNTRRSDIHHTRLVLRDKSPWFNFA